MRRGIKRIIIIAVIMILLSSIGLLIYFNLRHQDRYHLVDLGPTNDTVADFVDKSELQFFSNGTFHIQIEHRTKGLDLMGIGTYVYEDNAYKLTFTKVIGRDNNDTLVDLTASFKPEPCVYTGRRITFVNHKNQIYRFG